MIELSMQPRTIPVPWKIFRTTAAPFSLAIDGFVPEGPEFDPTIPVMNLNHIVASSIRSVACPIRSRSRSCGSSTVSTLRKVVRLIGGVGETS